MTQKIIWHPKRSINFEEQIATLNASLFVQSTFYLGIENAAYIACSYIKYANGQVFEYTFLFESFDCCSNRYTSKNTLNVLCQNILSSITTFELKLGVNFYVLRASQYCLDMKHFEYTGKQHKFLKFQKSHKPNSL